MNTVAAKVAGGTFALNNDKALVVGSITRTVGGPAGAT